MSTSDTPDAMVLLLRRLVERNGTWALCKVLAALVVWLLLHLARAGLVLVVRVLAGVMSRVDRYATRALTTVPDRPINHYFDCHNDHDYNPAAGSGRLHWEAVHV